MSRAEIEARIARLSEPTELERWRQYVASRPDTFDLLEQIAERLIETGRDDQAEVIVEAMEVARPYKGRRGDDTWARYHALARIAERLELPAEVRAEAERLYHLPMVAAEQLTAAEDAEAKRLYNLGTEEGYTLALAKMAESKRRYEEAVAAGELWQGNEWSRAIVLLEDALTAWVEQQ